MPGSTPAPGGVRAGDRPGPAREARPAGAAPGSGTGGRPSTGRGRARLSAFVSQTVLLAPATVLISVFMLLPIALAAYLSFTDWNGLTPDPRRVGWANYARLLQDADVGHAAVVTLVVTLVGTVACNAAGLALAVLLNRSGRLTGLLRAVVFYPYVIGPIIIGFLWSAILGANGAIAGLLTSAGHSPLPFLSDPTWAVGSIVAVVVWSQFGVNVVLYLAGLQTIPVSLVEAARMDGATRWQVFRSVTWPMLAPSVTVNLVLVLVGLLRVYEIVLALTGGGPAGRTSTFAFLILSESFRTNHLGYGAAQAMTLTVVIGALALAITALRRRAEQAVSA
ncbi:sugar-transporter integral membrane protein [Sphaerisporangium melleum]|uniref:Sugar-transporter integral membrane protein n=1 Tax=Sphaerisporangium melleum TaxID=321316 RepID=A0A917R7E7_9ACTN|nr:sugar ABC transporter permease [Sphaerisporangium melleum]GGK93815.1 sugar-transporter integral membrane protein [Sphaerisporangium melleum]GII73374.1 sugar-transporter integral membrane protein [Sphaerisporangium melleum]